MHRIPAQAGGTALVEDAPVARAVHRVGLRAWPEHREQLFRRVGVQAAGGVAAEHCNTLFRLLDAWQTVVTAACRDAESKRQQVASARVHGAVRHVAARRDGQSCSCGGEGGIDFDDDEASVGADAHDGRPERVHRERVHFDVRLVARRPDDLVQVQQHAGRLPLALQRNDANLRVSRREHAVDAREARVEPRLRANALELVVGLLPRQLAEGRQVPQRDRLVTAGSDDARHHRPWVDRERGHAVLVRRDHHLGVRVATRPGHGEVPERDRTVCATREQPRVRKHQHAQHCPAVPPGEPCHRLEAAEREHADAAVVAADRRNGVGVHTHDLEARHLRLALELRAKHLPRLAGAQLDERRPLLPHDREPLRPAHRPAARRSAERGRISRRRARGARRLPLPPRSHVVVVEPHAAHRAQLAPRPRAHGRVVALPRV
mmetsp:Transcript_6512/g.26527  ORF Transcript_6512/g.26527 Transcript_6512/m.26527 type:complete len:434 (-) Transcript_6512:265-1566(-)